jgi:hypothetical protein
MLWARDSLVYATFAQYQAVTGLSGGASPQFFFGSPATHPRAPRRTLRAAAGLGRTAYPPSGTLAVDDVVVGLWIRVENLSPGSDAEQELLRTVSATGTEVSFEILEKSTDKWALRISTSYVLAETHELDEQVWYFLEIRVHHDSTDGEIEVRIDNTQAYYETGLRTYDSAPPGAAINAVVFPLDPDSFMVDYADLYVCDIAGDAPFNGFVGPEYSLPVKLQDPHEKTGWDVTDDDVENLNIFQDSSRTGLLSGSAISVLVATPTQIMPAGPVIGIDRKAAYTEASGDDLTAELDVAPMDPLPTPASTLARIDSVDIVDAPEIVSGAIIDVILE